MHSKSLMIQEISLQLFQANTSQKDYQYALNQKILLQDLEVSCKETQS